MSISGESDVGFDSEDSSHRNVLSPVSIESPVSCDEQGNLDKRALGNVVALSYSSVLDQYLTSIHPEIASLTYMIKKNEFERRRLNKGAARNPPGARLDLQRGTDAVPSEIGNVFPRHRLHKSLHSCTRPLNSLIRVKFMSHNPGQRACLKSVNQGATPSFDILASWTTKRIPYAPSVARLNRGFAALEVAYGSQTDSNGSRSPDDSRADYTYDGASDADDAVSSLCKE